MFFYLEDILQFYFTPDEVEVLTAYSELVKITIDNAFLYHKMAKQERLEKVEIAKEIQQNLLPREMPIHPRYEFAGLMIPAREIEGIIMIYLFHESPGKRYSPWEMFQEKDFHRYGNGCGSHDYSFCNSKIK